MKAELFQRVSRRDLWCAASFARNDVERTGARQPYITTLSRFAARVMPV